MVAWVNDRKHNDFPIKFQKKNDDRIYASSGSIDEF